MKEKILSALTCLTTIFSGPVAAAQQASNTAATVIMVPPEGFRHNEQTAASNVFQNKTNDNDPGSRAMQEFKDMVDLLRDHGVNVLILHQDRSLPDAVFPNNWFSTEINKNGKTDVYIYPMLTENRRAEVNIENLQRVLKENHVNVNEVIDVRKDTDKILEGTGSLILDRKNRIVYAALSERTDKELAAEFAARLNYQAILFHAVDTRGFPIYHTNVVMGLGDDFSIACLECIKDSKERALVEKNLKKLGSVIAITQAQMLEMCGNVLAVRNNKGEKLLVMSERAKRNFTPQQLSIIRKSSKIIDVNIDTIERIGGGSARCMMAEIFHQ